MGTIIHPVRPESALVARPADDTTNEVMR